LFLKPSPTKAADDGVGARPTSRLTTTSAINRTCERAQGCNIIILARCSRVRCLRGGLELGSWSDSE
jgi:hypothetical protein